MNESRSTRGGKIFFWEKKTLNHTKEERITLNTITCEEEKYPIWEVASSHMARRVLVGNLYIEVKAPNLIAKISGHVENSWKSRARVTPCAKVALTPDNFF